MLKVEDLSKMGTVLDGVRLESNKPVVLSNNEHEIKMGSWEHTLKLAYIGSPHFFSANSSIELNGSKCLWL